MFLMHRCGLPVAKHRPNKNARARMSSLGLETRLKEGDLLAIHTGTSDPVLDQLVQGYNARQITEKLVLAVVKGPEAARLVQEIDAECDSTIRVGPRRAGRRKLLGGSGLVAAGVGVAAVGAYFSGASGYLVAGRGREPVLRGARSPGGGGLCKQPAGEPGPQACHARPDVLESGHRYPRTDIERLRPRPVRDAPALLKERPPCQMTSRN